MALQVRRVVTGHDKTGKAIITLDEISQNVRSSRPKTSACVVWTSEGFPISNDADADGGSRDPGDVGRASSDQVGEVRAAAIGRLVPVGDPVARAVGPGSNEPPQCLDRGPGWQTVRGRIEVDQSGSRRKQGADVGQRVWGGALQGGIAGRRRYAHARVAPPKLTQWVLRWVKVFSASTPRSSPSPLILWPS